MEESKRDNPSGFLLIDKPTDWTSHDVVGYLRKITQIKKIGHAGTLDPFATGLLIVGIGREATKRLDEFKGMDKTYVATIQLGATSDTYDRTGKIEKFPISNFQFSNNKQCINETMGDPINNLSVDIMNNVLKNFIGKQEQLPPMYSAKKVGGKKLYDLARKGIEIERKPHLIEIYKLELMDYYPKSQLLMVNCHVSTGTYIRTLAHDIGQALGTGAYCKELERTTIGPYTLGKAIPIQEATMETIATNLFQ